MKKNRIIITLLLLAGALSALGAESIDEIIESAKANSLSYQNIVLNYQSGLLTISEMEKKDEVDVTVETGIIQPLMPDSASDSYKLSLSPTVTVTLPNDGSTEISAGTSLTTRYKNGETTVGANLGVSHTFDFTGYKEDTADDLKYASTKYSTERTYKTSELSFEESVLRIIKEILTQESAIKQAEFNLEKQQTAFDKLVALKKYSEDSSTYKSTLNTLNSRKSSLASAKEQYDNLLQRYKTLTGLEWNGVDVGDAPTLTLTTYEKGNTEVLEKSLDAESSEETYKKTIASLNQSSLTTDLNASISNIANKTQEITISGTATYNAKDWEVVVSPEISIGANGKTTPGLTISGRWSNGSSSSDSTINKALNEAKVAANNYLEALSSYEEKASSYALQIIEWNNELSQAEADLECMKTILENADALYGLGLYTEEEKKSDELNYSVSKTNYDNKIIDGLILERELAIFAL